ncbi:MAG: hypothetical protein Q7R85_01620 [bacterium]|nr:hypothetical protein [bacterium]
MVPLKEMAIRVLLNLGELDPKDYSVSVFVGALQLRNECSLVWNALRPRLRECSDTELEWLYMEYAYTDDKEMAALERELKGRVSRLPAPKLIELLERICFTYSPEQSGGGGELEDVADQCPEDVEEDATILASWLEAASARFASMTNGELGSCLRESMDDPVRLAIMDVLVPRTKQWTPDEVLLFWRDAECDVTFFEVMKSYGFTLEACSASAILQAFDAPNARWIWEKCDELLYGHIGEFKRIAGITT